MQCTRQSASGETRPKQRAAAQIASFGPNRACDRNEGKSIRGVARATVGNGSASTARADMGEKTFLLSAGKGLQDFVFCDRSLTLSPSEIHGCVRSKYTSLPRPSLAGFV